MEYNKLHDIAIQFGKTLIKKDSDLKEWVEDMLPELKEESEDEKIKDIIKHALSFYFEGKLSIGTNETDYAECLSWLEKQGEQRPVEWHREDEQNLNACLGYIPDEFLRRWLMDAIHVKYDKSAWSEEDELHIRELESIVKQEWAIAECENDKDKIHKMSDLSFFLKTLKPQLKQEWSEEDEKSASYICAALDCYYRLRNDNKNVNGQEKLDNARTWLYNRLKQIKPQPKQEWSEEDEKFFNTALWQY
jgi:hypothetical protein